ncbi:hypothetical protein BJX99DRAFT_9080 [Aspergillus californicus]
MDVEERRRAWWGVLALDRNRDPVFEDVLPVDDAKFFDAITRRRLQRPCLKRFHLDWAISQDQLRQHTSTARPSLPSSPLPYDTAT